VRESHRVARPHAQLAAARQIVEGPRDDPQTHGIELLQKRGDVAWQRAVDEGLQKNGLGAVLALVHRNELAKHCVGALAAGSPALDATDERLRSTAKRGLDKAFLRRRVEIHRARRDVRAARDVDDAKITKSVASDLPQRGTLDRDSCPRGASCALALYVPP